MNEKLKRLEKCYDYLINQNEYFKDDRQLFIELYNVILDLKEEKLISPIGQRIINIETNNRINELEKLYLSLTNKRIANI